MLPVTFIDDRNGHALVRLPNGTKTSVGYDALDERPAWGHFVADQGGPGGVVHCLATEACHWSAAFEAWPAGAAALQAHCSPEHAAQ